MNVSSAEGVSQNLEFTGERYLPSEEGQIKYEHIHRYALCLPFVENRAVLDLASGEGYGAALLADVATSVTGVDISPESVKHATHKYYRKNLRFLVGSCDSVPLPDASVDVVTSFETIEHHDKHEEMMQEIKRVLKPAGILVISSPNRWTYSDEPKYSNPFHIKELYFDEFSTLLGHYFKHVMIYGQRLATASFVYSLHSPEEKQLTSYSGSTESLVQKATSLHSPLYFVSVCSDEPAICATSSASVYIDAADDLMEKANVQADARTNAELISQRTAYEAELVRVRAHYEAQIKQQTDEFAQAQSLSADQLAQLTDEKKKTQADYEVQVRQLTDQFSETRSALEKRLAESARESSESQAMYEEKLERQSSENQSQIAQLSQQIEEITLQTKKQDALLSDSNVQLQEKSREVKERSREAELRTREVEQRTREVKERTREVELRTREVRERTREVELRTREVEEKQRQTEEQARQLEALTQELEQKDLKLQFAGWQLREVDQRVQAKRRELANLQEIFQATLDDFSNSGSYRLGRALTSPLRAVKKYVFAANGSDPSDVSKHIGLLSDVSDTLERKNEDDTQERRTLTNSLDFAAPVGKAPEIEPFPGSPDVLFDVDWYVSQNLDVAKAGVDPLQHYLELGAKEGRSPHPLFDPKFYLKTYPDAAIDGRNPLHHYLTEGWKKGYKPNPKFDPLFYVTMYPDIAEAGVEPLTHFVSEGLREGRAGCSEDISLVAFEADFEIPRTPLSDNTAFESDIKAIAFYLPQFHPIPENDSWWGHGFTEWTNVRRGQPQFKDHYQPHVPSILDYYDLREPDVLEKQVKLARDHGISGFCFYYYWFAGKILLDLPIRRMLETGKPDFPFCICWANENWTRRWDGRENDILIAQQHSPEDDIAFLRNIQSILLHKNYIRVDGKPLLIVYQPTLLPDAHATAARWRDYFRAEGHGSLFLATMQTFSDTTPPSEYGFDAVIQFPPHHHSWPVNCTVEDLDKSFAGHVQDYNRTKWRYIDELGELNSSRNIYPGVMPSWDNTARRQNKSSIWVNASPESYYDWLFQVSNFLRRNRPPDDRLVFINAWNEWAEGCHLEPDQRLGHAWLNATRMALQSERSAS